MASLRYAACKCPKKISRLSSASTLQAVIRYYFTYPSSAHSRPLLSKLLRYCSNPFLAAFVSLRQHRLSINLSEIELAWMM